MENTNFKVFIEEKTQDYGKLCIEPLERGYGDTLGNALRRLLLSSIRGAAVTAVRIEGILHEFSTIPGVREDVIEILMNLKHIPIKARNEKARVNEEGFKIITIDSDELPKNFFTRSENSGVITAKDLNSLWGGNDFEFCGDGVLCTLEPNAHLLMEIYVEQGVGYLSAERERPAQPPLPIDALLTDAIFSPVKRVNYQVEPARVGQSIDFDRLIIEVWTNGAISPDEAVGQAARIAENYFCKIAEEVNAPTIRLKDNDDNDNDNADTNKIKGGNDVPKNLKPSDPIANLELSIRSVNCLLRGGITTIGDLLSKSRDDLLEIRNLGKISLTEIEERLTTLGFELAPSPVPPAEPTEGNSDLSEIFSSEEAPENLVTEIQDMADNVLDNVEADVKETQAQEAQDENNADEKPEKKATKKTSKPKSKKAKAEEVKEEVKVEALASDDVKAEVVETQAEEVKPEEVREVKAEEKPKKSKAKKATAEAKTEADDGEEKPKPKAKSKPKAKKVKEVEAVEAVKDESKEQEVQS